MPQSLKSRFAHPKGAVVGLADDVTTPRGKQIIDVVTIHSAGNDMHMWMGVQHIFHQFSDLFFAINCDDEDLGLIDASGMQ